MGVSPPCCRSGSRPRVVAAKLRPPAQRSDEPVTTDAPSTAAARLRHLCVTLALPWLVCGGLLWTLVRLTPEPYRIWDMHVAYPPPGLLVGFGSDIGTARVFEPSRTELVLGWNMHVLAHPDTEWTEWDGRRSGVIAYTFRSPSGGSAFAAIRAWWLLPAPLLWTGFNLWRWVRGTDRPATGSAGRGIAPASPVTGFVVRNEVSHRRAAAGPHVAAPDAGNPERFVEGRAGEAPRTLGPSGTLAAGTRPPVRRARRRRGSKSGLSGPPPGGRANLDPNPGIVPKPVGHWVSLVRGRSADRSRTCGRSVPDASSVRDARFTGKLTRCRLLTGRPRRGQGDARRRAVPPHSRAPPVPPRCSPPWC